MKYCLGRAQTENEVRKALELSLACESLLVSLKYGDHGEPLPLRNHVEAIQDVSTAGQDLKQCS